MTAPVILVEAQPALASTGAAVAVRLAGGGAVKPYYYNASHYLAGLGALPTVIQSLEYDGGELGTGGVPSALELRWTPASHAQLATIAGYYWNDAPITIRIGPEGAYPAVTLSGKVLDAVTENGTLRIALADPAADLKKPFPITRYLGTGGLEGPVEWEGTVKRRLFGRVWNVRGEPIDKANNIYCFGDPTKPVQSIDTVRDKGAIAASLNTVAWAGTAAATLAALQAAVAPQGGGVVAPSIDCVKWWTQPAGDLTADIKGEIGTGYVETTAEIAERLVLAAAGPAFLAGTVATAAAARTAPVGWVVKDENTATSAMLDELLGNSSLLWVLTAAGEIVIREWAWGASAASAKSHDVNRKSMLKPLATRKLGYRRNETVMGRGDIAGIVLAEDINGLDITARYPDAPPLNPLEGTLYIDATGRQYRFEGIELTFNGEAITFNGEAITTSGWVDVQDKAIGAAQAAADSALALASLAQSLAADAQATADGKIDSFYQSAAPASASIGDLWYDTDDGNKPYRWSGSAWDAVQDGGISTALSAATTAQATADGKVTTFVQEATPAAEGDGDLWFKQSSGELRRWTAGSPGSWGNPLVDLTSAAVPSVFCPPAVALSADYLGAITTGQLPVTLNATRKRGDTDVSGSTTWSIVGVTGLQSGSGAITVSSAGVVTIPDTLLMGAQVDFIVRSVRDSVTLDAPVKITKTNAAPPATGGGGGGTTAVDTSFGAVTGTGMTAISDIMTVHTGSGGQISFSASLSVFATAASPTGTFDVASIWRWRAVGGSFADVGTEQTSDPDVIITVESGVYFREDGTLYVTGVKTGLTASTDYEVQLFARRTSASPAKTITFAGTASAFGS